MRRSFRDDMMMASLALAIAFSAPVFAQDDSNREQMVDMVLQIQQLQDELRMLRGQIEEQTHQIATLKSRQRDQYLDLDQRISELSSMRVATMPANPAAGSVSVTPGYIPPEEDVPEIRTEDREPSAVVALATPQSQARTAAATPEAEQAMYDNALKSVTDLRYSDAAEEFQAFQQAYPQSDLADNAQYWLGESYYVTRNYEIALEAFQELLVRYPQSAKLPDTLLKIGYTHYELKQWDLARAALTQLKEQYPNTSFAHLAENRLDSMRVEGHF